MLELELNPALGLQDGKDWTSRALRSPKNPPFALGAESLDDARHLIGCLYR